MDLLVVRHAAAATRRSWTGDDRLRPLTKAGRKDARSLLQKLVETLPPPECVISSKANRASETAEILRKVWHLPKVVLDARGNPGSKAWLSRVIREHAQASCLAVVGHEPDLSEQAQRLLRMKGPIVLRKGAILWIQDASGTPTLRMLIAPADLHD